MNTSKFTKTSVILLIFALACLSVSAVFAVAPGSEVTLGGAASNLTDSMSYLAQFLTSLAYVLGFGFGVAAILQYKAHRDNPSQVTLAKPIALLFIALAFVFMPMIFAVSGDTIFGPAAEQGTAHGVSSF